MSMPAETLTASAARRNNIAALNATTGSATDWNPNAAGTVRALAVNGTTVYAGGEFTNIGGQPRNGIAAINAAGSATAWNPNATGDCLCPCSGRHDSLCRRGI